MAQWIEGTVVESIHWTPILFSLKIESDLKPFIAGQFTLLALDIDGQRIARPYTLISAPNVKPHEIFFYAATGGKLSPEIQKLAVANKVWLQQPPIGFFVLDEIPPAQDLWMLATGTGIAPFMSILTTQEVWSKFSKVILVQSVRSQSDLLYQDRIEAIRTAHPKQFVHQAMVSREKLPGTLNSRIPAAIESGKLEQQVGIQFGVDSSQFMLCGNPGMTAEAVRILKARGFSRNRSGTPGQLTTENYW